MGPPSQLVLSSYLLQLCLALYYIHLALQLYVELTAALL